LTLAIALWCIVIYSFRVAVFGDPIYNLLVGASAETVNQAEKLMQHPEQVREMPHSYEPAQLLRRFSRLTLFEFGAFILEMALLICLAVTGTLAVLCLVLIIKNILVMLLSLYHARTLAENRYILEAMRALPAYVITVDRLSSLVSGFGFLLFFLTLNNLIRFG
jgi:hypothetical protein